jgi:hypothetical protein
MERQLPKLRHPYRLVVEAAPVVVVDLTVVDLAVAVGYCFGRV